MANYEYLTTTGQIIPDTATIRDDVENEYKAIFGDDLITDPETPQGALITAEITSRQSVLRNNARVGNQINPLYSGGTFLDSIWALTNGSRVGQSQSTVQCVVTGVPGTTIPAGSRASQDSGNEWQSSAEIVIPTSGAITASFLAVDFGPLFASVGTITNVVTGILGWETVTNNAVATPGRNTQSDSSSRISRREQISLQGQSTAGAISARLSATEGVRSFTFRENIEPITQVIDGITLVRQSIWAAVDGGTDIDVATQLLEAKSGGSNWNGSVAVPVVEPESGQTFNVLFDRPIQVDIRIRITSRAVIGSDPENQIKDSVIDYANGLSIVGRGFVTGNDVSPYEIASAINVVTPISFVSNVELALNIQTPVYSPATLLIALNQIATVDRSSIEVIFV